MSPSINEKLRQISRPDDLMTDLEDMSLVQLRLGQGVSYSTLDLSNQLVTLDIVDPTKDFHRVTVNATGMRLKFSNDQDVYE